MAYDEGLAQRIREWVDERPGASEKRMFGGLCVLVRGNMACGVVGEELMLRVGPDAYAEALRRPHAREMDFTGRELRGMVYVSTDGIEEDAELWSWLELAWDFASALPAKGPKSVRKAAKKKAAKKQAAKENAARKKATRKSTRKPAVKRAARKQRPARKS